MQIKINKPGLLTTIQDRGRQLFLNQAVPVSGVMDLLSAALANIVLGNDRNAAVLEFTYAAASFVTQTSVLISYVGDGAFLTINGKLLPGGKPVFIPANKTIELINNPAGCRTYVAVAGGWNVPEVLVSRSTYIPAGMGGYKGRALQQGDLLESVHSTSNLSKAIFDFLKGDQLNFPDWYVSNQSFLPANRNPIRVVEGPEKHWFTDESFVAFLSKPFILSQQSNRMGYQLQGHLLHKKISRELLSTAVVPGTIQVTGGGNPILLMTDCQTTGGYPRIAQVAAVDMPLCAQLKPGDQIYFSLVSQQEAMRLYIEREEQLVLLENVVKCKYLSCQ